jgi:hypothetical protein
MLPLHQRNQSNSVYLKETNCNYSFASIISYIFIHRRHVRRTDFKFFTIRPNLPYPLFSDQSARMHTQPSRHTLMIPGFTFTTAGADDLDIITLPLICLTVPSIMQKSTRVTDLSISLNINYIELHNVRIGLSQKGFD